MSSSRREDVRDVVALHDSAGCKEDSDDDDDDDGDEDVENDEQYPPWLADVARECPYTVQVLEEEVQVRRNGYIKCKRVELPDAFDCARGKAPRTYKLKKYSTILVLAGPNEAPYIGLVDQIWRKAAAVPVGGQPGIYQAVDLQVECYYFYRRSELPNIAWAALKRTANMPASIKGARYANSSIERPAVEEDSPRQVLFSSHHTQHDAQAAGPPGINMSAVLQTCKMHWLGPHGRPPERYAVHRSRLIRTREHGFVVQGFLWCNSRGKAQFAAHYKRAFPLDGSWNDAETAMIVQLMCKNYQKTAASLKERNRRVLERYRQHKLMQQHDVVTSDDGQEVHPQTLGRPGNLQQSAAAHQQQQSRQQLQQPAQSNSPHEEESAIVHAVKGLGHGKQQQRRQDTRLRPEPGVLEAQSSSDSDDNITLIRRLKGGEVSRQQTPR